MKTWDEEVFVPADETTWAKAIYWGRKKRKADLTIDELWRYATYRAKTIGLEPEEARFENAWLNEIDRRCLAQANYLPMTSSQPGQISNEEWALKKTPAQSLLTAEEWEQYEAQFETAAARAKARILQHEVELKRRRQETLAGLERRLQETLAELGRPRLSKETLAKIAARRVAALAAAPSRKCPCGRAFPLRAYTQKYCSIKCRTAHLRKTVRWQWIEERAALEVYRDLVGPASRDQAAGILRSFKLALRQESFT